MFDRYSSRLIAVVAIAAGGFVTGCQHAVQTVEAQAPSTESLHWLEGCWLSEDGNVEEVWARSRHGDQLFGFSVVSASGQREFFEQMRVDVGVEATTFYAYPAGRAATAFEGNADRDGQVTFVNPATDFPQKIHYRRDGQRLLATVSLIDGAQATSWQYAACPE
ncbi:MAG: DUF6265 family protein [Pseudomonadota bacterium]